MTSEVNSTSGPEHEAGGGLTGPAACTGLCVVVGYWMLVCWGHTVQVRYGYGYDGSSSSRCVLPGYWWCSITSITSTNNFMVEHYLGDTALSLMGIFARFFLVSIF